MKLHIFRKYIDNQLLRNTQKLNVSFKLSFKLDYLFILKGKINYEHIYYDFRIRLCNISA